jgi:hypothetical protein
MTWDTIRYIMCMNWKRHSRTTDHERKSLENGSGTYRNKYSRPDNYLCGDWFVLGVLTNF